MSTIFGFPDVIKGVRDGGAGFVYGVTVNEAGAVPVKASLIAGKRLVAGISASVTPLEKVARCEFGSDPAVMAAGQASRILLPNLALVSADAFNPVPQYL